MSNASATGQRTNFFLACEGESEYSYVKFLDSLADKHSRKRVHLDPFVINGGGNPNRILEQSEEKYESKLRNKIGGYKKKLILMDSDIYQRCSSNIRNEFVRQLNAKKFGVIWQKPDHEGFLIRHFSNSVTPRLGHTVDQLQKFWPNYHKNMPVEDIEKKLDINCVKLASNSVPEFKKFLKAIGFNF